MGKYILRRLIIALPSLLGISLILFVLLALAPGDPFGELATNTNIPPEVRAALRVGKPAVIEIPIDPDEFPTPVQAVRRQAEGQRGSL